MRALGGGSGVSDGANDRGFLVSLPQEYVDYYGGAGVQHIALKTQDIITTVRSPFLALIHLPFSSGAHLCGVGGGVGSPEPPPLARRADRAPLLVPATHVGTFPPRRVQSLCRTFWALETAGARETGSLDSLSVLPVTCCVSLGGEGIRPPLWTSVAFP